MRGGVSTSHSTSSCTSPVGDITSPSPLKITPSREKRTGTMFWSDWLPRFILLAIMWLWAPNEDSQRFAYSAQLDEEQEGMGSVEKAEVMSNEDVDVIGARG